MSTWDETQGASDIARASVDSYKCGGGVGGVCICKGLPRRKVSANCSHAARKYFYVIKIYINYHKEGIL